MSEAKLIHCGFVMVANRAMRLARTPAHMGALLQIYATGDQWDWEPFKAPDSWLTTTCGLPRHQAREMLDDLVSLGCVEIVFAGNRRSPRKILVLKPASRQNNLDNNPDNNPTDSEKGDRGGNTEEAKPPRQQPLKQQSKQHITRPPDSDLQTQTSPEQVWEQLNAIRKEHGHREVKLTDARKRILKARIEEHTVEDVLTVIRWWITSDHERAANVRENYNVDTLLRPSKFTGYLEYAQAEAPTATVDEGQVIARSRTAWKFLKDRVNGDSTLPQALSAMSSRTRELMGALIHDAGGEDHVATLLRDYGPGVPRDIQHAMRIHLAESRDVR